MSCQEIFVSSRTPHGRICSTCKASDSSSNHTPLPEEKRQIAEAAKQKAVEILRDALKKKERVLMEKPQDLVSADSGDPIFWMERHAILTEELVRRLISELEAVKFKEDLTRENTYAYVYPKSGDKTVYLCPLFWKAPTDLEKDSQPGTLIHEVSHFLGIRDITYSKESISVACRGKLVKSKSDPSAPVLNPLGKAVLNANNIEYEFEITLKHKEKYKSGQYSCCGEKAENSVCARAVRDEFLLHDFRESEKRKNISEIMKASLLPTAKRLQGHVNQLRNMADEIDETHKNAITANVWGGLMGIAGSMAGLAGLMLAPVTFGSSLVLPMAGFAVSTAGGITSAAATIRDEVKSSNKMKEVEKILKECQDILQLIEEEFAKITEKMNKMGDGSDPDSPIVLQAGLGVGKAVLNSCKLLKAGKMVADAGKATSRTLASNAGKATSRTLASKAVKATSRTLASNAGKATSRTLTSNARQAAKLAGNVTRGLIGITVLLDVAFLVKDSKELMDGAKTKLADEIRKEAAKMAEVIETVNKFHRSVSQSPG